MKNEVETQEIIKNNNKKSNKLFLIILIIILFLVLLIVLAKYYYPHTFKVKEYGVINNKLPESFNGLKIIQIGDIHYKTTVNKKFLTKVIKEINTLKPDIVIFNGDLFDQNVRYKENDFETLKELFRKIDFSIAKYAIFGENDYKYEEKYRNILANSDFTLLDNSYDLIYYKGNTPIFIGGISSLLQNKSDIKATFAYFNDNDSDLYKLVVMHEPDNIKNLQEYDVDLCLAGHSHNGQINLPFIGAIYNYKGAKLYYDNYYKIKNTDFYITNGLGTTFYPYRLFNKPSFTLFRIYNN